MEEAQADVKALAGVKGWNDEVMQMLPHMFIFGDPDTVGEKLRELMNTGIDGLTINLPVNGHNTDRIGLLGQVANAAID
jgi:alkanesulfonate monooxygenase SsuD/methylene tetrahydromethanopterin reductase-like flavin-dependent oxidoreductase (luciferase family)